MHSSKFDETLLNFVREYGENDFSLIQECMYKCFPQTSDIQSLKQRFCKLTGRPSENMVLPTSFACDSEDDTELEFSPLGARETKFSLLDMYDEAPDDSDCFDSSCYALPLDPDPYGRCRRQRNHVDTNSL